MYPVLSAWHKHSTTYQTRPVSGSTLMARTNIFKSEFIPNNCEIIVSSSRYCASLSHLIWVDWEHSPAVDLFDLVRGDQLVHATLSPFILPLPQHSVERTQQGADVTLLALCPFTHLKHTTWLLGQIQLLLLHQLEASQLFCSLYKSSKS